MVKAEKDHCLGSLAQSVILMLLVIALTVLQFRYVDRRVSISSRHGLNHQDHTSGEKILDTLSEGADIQKGS